MRIVSLLPAATEIVAALGLGEMLVGVSHECDYPEIASRLPRVTHCPIYDRGLSSEEVDRWVHETLAAAGTLYALDEALLHELRPDVILTQQLCDVCAVGYGSVAKLAATLPGPPRVLNLEPMRLRDVYENIRTIAGIAGEPQRGEHLVTQLEARVQTVNEQAIAAVHRPRCFLMEWADPPFCAGHWNPELVQLAGGHEIFGRSGERSVRVPWESVVQAQPEVLILALCGWSVERARQDLTVLQRYGEWNDLRAVRNGQVYIVDGNAYFSRPGPRLVDAIELLAGIFHPETFPQFAIQYWQQTQVAQI